MSYNTASFNGKVPDSLWSKNKKDIVKVIIQGINADRLSNNFLEEILKKNEIIVNRKENNIDILMIESKRKRYVYSKRLRYEHRQTIHTSFEGQALTILLIDPTESRAEVTLLHMPIETNQEVIKHIFQSMNPEWKATNIRHAPGDQKRGDRCVK